MPEDLSVVYRQAALDIAQQRDTDAVARLRADAIEALAAGLAPEILREQLALKGLAPLIADGVAVQAPEWLRNALAEATREFAAGRDTALAAQLRDSAREAMAAGEPPADTKRRLVNLGVPSTLADGLLRQLAEQAAAERAAAEAAARAAAEKAAAEAARIEAERAAAAEAARAYRDAARDMAAGKTTPDVDRVLSESRAALDSGAYPEQLKSMLIEKGFAPILAAGVVSEVAAAPSPASAAAVPPPAPAPAEAQPAPPPPSPAAAAPPPPPAAPRPRNVATVPTPPVAAGRCPSCGAGLRSGAKFCGKCGRPAVGAAAEA